MKPICISCGKQLNVVGMLGLQRAVLEDWYRFLDCTLRENNYQFQIVKSPELQSGILIRGLTPREEISLNTIVLTSAPVGPGTFEADCTSRSKTGIGTKNSTLKT
jgi:hypothetical protein